MFNFEAFCEDQRLEQTLVNVLQMEVYIFWKTLSNGMRIPTGLRICAFKNQKWKTISLLE